MRTFVALALALAPARALAAVDAWLCIEGLTGTCTEQGVEENAAWRPVAAARFGAANLPAPGAPFSAGQGVLRPVELDLAVNHGGPPLWAAALSGAPLGRVSLAFQRAGGARTNAPHHILRLDGARVASARIVSDGEGQVLRLTLDGLTGGDARYWTQRSDGTLSQPPTTTEFTVSP